MEMESMPESVYNDIVVMLEQGFSVREICDETGWPEDIVREIRHEAGFFGRVIDPLRGIDTDQMVEAYQKGEERVIDIAEAHGISVPKLYRVLALLGVPVRKHDPFVNKAKERRMDEAVAMYEAGYPWWQIEEDVGISQPTISKELHKRGVTLRRPRRGSNA